MLESSAGVVFAVQHRHGNIGEQPRDRNLDTPVEHAAGEHIAPAARGQGKIGGAPIGSALAIQPIAQTRHSNDKARFAAAPHERAEVIAAAARRFQGLVVAFGEQFRMGSS